MPATPSVLIKLSDDLPLVAAIHMACFPYDDFHNERSHYWVALEGKQAVGYLSAQLDEQEYHELDDDDDEPTVLRTAHLSHVGVLPRWRGKGLMGDFLRTFEAWARAEKVGLISTYVKVGNWPSLVRFVKAGWQLHELETDEDLELDVGDAEPEGSSYITLFKSLLPGATPPPDLKLVR